MAEFGLGSTAKPTGPIVDFVGVFAEVVVFLLPGLVLNVDRVRVPHGPPIGNSTVGTLLHAEDGISRPRVNVTLGESQNTSTVYGGGISATHTSQRRGYVVITHKLGLGYAMGYA